MATEPWPRPVGKKINALGSAYMFAEGTVARGQELGLDGLSFYGLGRFGVLGGVEPDVVASAAFFFEPSMVAGVWNAARQKVDPLECARAYSEACAAWGRERIGAVDGLDEFTSLAERVAGAADVRGLALFAGWRSQPLADDAPGRAMQLVNVLRELRGGANGLATRVAGLTPAEAVLVNAGEGMARMMGWQGDLPDPEPLRERVDSAEDLTDKLVLPAFEVLDGDERARFASVVDAIHAAGVG